MRFARKLVPAFLWQWDLHLLQRHPRLWATRLHLHLWFILLGNALAFVLGMLIGVSERKFPDPEALFGYMMVPTVVYFCFWIYRVVRFTVERRFGERKPYSEVGELLLHLVSIALIMTMPYTLSLTVAMRIASLTSDAEFKEEVDLLNEQAPWFYGMENSYDYDYDDSYDYDDYSGEYDGDAVVATTEASNPYDTDLNALYNAVKPHYALGSGTHEFFRNFDEYRKRNAVTYDMEMASRAINNVPSKLHEIYTGYIAAAQAYSDEDTTNNDLDSAHYFYHLADSIERNYPLLYIQRGTFTPSYFEHPADEDSLREEAYLRNYAAKVPMDHEAIEHVLHIANKYSRGVRLMGADSVAAEFARRESSTARVGSCKRAMDRIARAKVLSYDFMGWGILAYGILLPCFFLSLLVSIFKNIYWQPFLIAIVTIILVPILILIIALITERDVLPYDDDDIMMNLHWLVQLFVLVMTATVLGMKAYRSNRAVMTILANLVVPTFAAFTLMLANEYFDVFGIDALSTTIDRIRELNQNDLRLVELDLQYQALRRHMEFVALCTLWGGIIIYIFGLHVYFRRLYTRLMALPETK